MKILISGGTGFIGTKICEYFLKQKFDIFILSRTLDSIKNNASVRFLTDLKNSEASYDIIINLAGEPLNKKRWNYKVKENIYKSRMQVTQKIIDYIKNAVIKPKLLLSGSAIGFYGIDEDMIFTENSVPTDHDFTHRLCRDWENAAMQASEYGVRVCLLRMGIVLGEQGGVLKEMSLPFRLGLGAQLGNGKQWMSWIYMQDVVSAIDFLIHHTTLSGPFNFTTPHPVTNKMFSQGLAAVFNRPCFLTLPHWVVAFLFGEMADALLLRGQQVIPSKLINAGYKFKIENLADALKAVFKK